MKNKAAPIWQKSGALRIDMNDYRQVSHLWAGVSHLFMQEVKYLLIYCGQMVRAEAMGSTAFKNLPFS